MDTSLQQVLRVKLSRSTLTLFYLVKREPGIFSQTKVGSSGGRWRVRPQSLALVLENQNQAQSSNCVPDTWVSRFLRFFPQPWVGTQMRQEPWAAQLLTSSCAVCGFESSFRNVGGTSGAESGPITPLPQSPRMGFGNPFARGDPSGALGGTRALRPTKKLLSPSPFSGEWPLD